MHLVPFLFFLCRSRLGCNLDGFFKVRRVFFLPFLSGNTTDCSLPFFLYRSRLEHHLDGFFKVRGGFFFLFFIFFYLGMLLTIPFLFFLCRSHLGCNLNGFFKVGGLFFPFFLFLLSGNATDHSLSLSSLQEPPRIPMEGFFKIGLSSLSIFFYILF